MQEKIQNAALLAIFANTMMLEVCDTLASTTLYKGKRKQLINTLTKDLEQFTAHIYTCMGEEEEAQYQNLVRTVEAVAKLTATLKIDEIPRFSALIMAFQSGEVYQATTDKQMQNMIDTKRVKLVEK